MDNSQRVQDRVPKEIWTIYRRCRFVLIEFHAYPCLIQIKPWENGTTFWKPYHGEAFDSAVFRLVKGGWDHEHCSVCAEKISEGDSYWRNDGSDQVCLCPICYPLVQAELAE